MGWLSKIILNGTEMLIKDASARAGIAELVQNIQYLQESINYIWNGIPPANGNIYYVAPNGDDTNNDGKSAEHPFATITHAAEVISYPIACHRACGTIIVAPGTYIENVKIGVSNSNLQYNIVLRGDITILGSFGVSNNKCWIFYDGSISENPFEIHIYRTDATDNIRGEDRAFCITESAEFNSNCEIYIADTGSQNAEFGADILYNTKVYSSNRSGGIRITGTYTVGTFHIVDSNLRAKINAENASSPVTYFALDSIVQIIDNSETQTITAYNNLFSGYNLSELE